MMKSKIETVAQFSIEKRDKRQVAILVERPGELNQVNQNSQPFLQKSTFCEDTRSVRILT
jgi:hypothetical protein